MAKINSFAELPTYSRKPAKQLVVFLHGVGADGYNLIGLAEDFYDILPDAHFIAPNAPFNYDMAPFGYQWFSLRNRDQSSMLAGIRETTPILTSFLAAELAKHNLTTNDLILIGFSQGTMMALHIALFAPDNFKAVVGFSGAWIGGKDTASEVCSKPPLLLVHGTDDDVVPYVAMNEAVSLLSQVSVPVASYGCKNLGHGINMEGIKQAREFIRKHV